MKRFVRLYVEQPAFIRDIFDKRINVLIEDVVCDTIQWCSADSFKRHDYAVILEKMMQHELKIKKLWWYKNLVNVSESYNSSNYEWFLELFGKIITEKKSVCSLSCMDCNDWQIQCEGAWWERENRYVYYLEVTRASDSRWFEDDMDRVSSDPYHILLGDVLKFNDDYQLIIPDNQSHATGVKYPKALSWSVEKIMKYANTWTPIIISFVKLKRDDIWYASATDLWFDIHIEKEINETAWYYPQVIDVWTKKIDIGIADIYGQTKNGKYFYVCQQDGMLWSKFQIYALPLWYIVENRQDISIESCFPYDWVSNTISFNGTNWRTKEQNVYIYDFDIASLMQ